VAVINRPVTNHFRKSICGRRLYIQQHRSGGTCLPLQRSIASTFL